MANTANKAAALRKADAAVARRADEFHRREKALREIIADYYYATDHAEKTKADVQAKADRLTNHTEMLTVTLMATALTS